MKKLLLVMLLLGSYLFGAMNLQTASKAELMTISGIGSKKADAIIKYRKTHKLKSANDLLKVDGIGQGIVKNVKGNVKSKNAANKSKKNLQKNKKSINKKSAKKEMKKKNHQSKKMKSSMKKNKKSKKNLKNKKQAKKKKRTTKKKKK